MSNWKQVALLDDIPPLGSRVVKSAQGDIAVFRTAEGEVFALLDKGSISVAMLPKYLAGVPVYCDMSARFLRLSVDEMAAMLIKDLFANGAVKLDNNLIKPTMRA